jgi:predicted PurR-regulated permease PerM
MFKTINFFFKKKNLSVLILYLLIFFLFLIFIYLSSPKFFNISKELLENNLKTNHNINL